MKILMISTDEKILERESDVALRHKEYGKNVEEIHIVVFSKKNVDVVKISENVNVFSTKSKNKFACVQDAVKIAKKIVLEKKFGKEDVITVQDPFLTALVGVNIKGMFGLFFEIQLHTDIGSRHFRREKFSNYIRFLIAKKTLPKADRIRVVSNRIKDFLIKNSGFKIDESKVEVRPIVVDFERIKNTPITIDLHKKYPQFTKVILMASRLTKEKDVKTALKAFKIVLKTHKRIGLVIVGSGPEVTDLKRSLWSLGLGENVAFEDWVNQETLFSYYKTADVFLSTSLYEGYGMSMVEAHTTNCPIVSTDAGIAREISENICPVRDYKCIASRLSKFL